MNSDIKLYNVAKAAFGRLEDLYRAAYYGHTKDVAPVFYNAQIKAWKNLLIHDLKIELDESAIGKVVLYDPRLHWPFEENLPVGTPGLLITPVGIYTYPDGNKTIFHGVLARPREVSNE